MTEKTYRTESGTIHYWTNGTSGADAVTLVFLPGLTADHRLFDKQIEYFKDKFSVFVWDAPGHGRSWPFELDFNLSGKAKWLDEILSSEGIARPVIIGQSMGGYVGQAYSQLFPGKLEGFISIDSAPLQKRYTTSLERWLLKRMEPVYRHYPWKWLLKQGPSGTALSSYGRNLMYEMMMEYDGDQDRYARLSGHGFRILAEAIEAGLPYEILCPALLICGEKDRAGSCIRDNNIRHKNTGIRLEWLPDSGHDSNTGRPDIVNGLIESFIAGCPEAASQGLQKFSPFICIRAKNRIFTAVLHRIYWQLPFMIEPDIVGTSHKHTINQEQVKGKRRESWLEIGKFSVSGIVMKRQGCFTNES